MPGIWWAKATCRGVDLRLVPEGQLYMDRRILYFINPISGTKAKSALRQMVERRSAAAGIDYSILPTEPDGNYDFLPDKIQQDNITDIVICGGDGTVNSVVSAIRGTAVQVGIVPMGSGNGLAFAAKIPSQPAKALDIIFRGQASWVDAFTVNDRFSCMLCGIGFDALVAHEFAKEKTRGLQTYIRIAAMHFFKAKPYVFDIRVRDSAFSTEAFFISIANSNQFGNHVTIAPQASLSDGLLDIVIVKKMNKFKLPFSVISQVTGNNAIQEVSDYTGSKNIIYLQTDQLLIGNPQLAPLHIDGEPVASREVLDIRIISPCFRLLQPAKPEGPYIG